MSDYYIYTDASVKEKSYTLVGVIVKDHHIVDIYYKRVSKRCNSNKAELKAVFKAKHYFRDKYGLNDCIVYTDNQSVADMHGSWCKWVRGHQTSRKNWKHRFNCLADYISRNGLENWRIYWYGKL